MTSGDRVPRGRVVRLPPAASLETIRLSPCTLNYCLLTLLLVGLRPGFPPRWVRAQVRHSGERGSSLQ